MTKKTTVRKHDPFGWHPLQRISLHKVHEMRDRLMKVQYLLLKDECTTEAHWDEVHKQVDALLPDVARLHQLMEDRKVW